MTDEEIERRLGRIEQAVGLPKGITEPPTEKIQSSVVGPLVELPEEEEGLDINDLLRRVAEMIEARFADLQPDVYEILEEYTSNENTLNEARTFITTIGIKLKILEVQSEATGDGVYNCYEQTLDATEWDDTAGDDKFDDKNSTSIEVLSLFESQPEAGVSELVTGDRMACWQWTDDEDNKRWVGVPIEQDTNPIRKAYPKNDAPDDTTITCFLDIDTTGEEIPVVCSVAGGENLNEALPRLADGDLIFVTNIDDAWYCTTIFQSSKDCVCSQ